MSNNQRFRVSLTIKQKLDERFQRLQQIGHTHFFLTYAPMGSGPSSSSSHPTLTSSSSSTPN
ncbi:unnamed protein product, partial [Rotaria magnacalcarata]